MQELAGRRDAAGAEKENKLSKNTENPEPLLKLASVKKKFPPKQESENNQSGLL